MLSIIIPTLNEENYLPRLLESIQKQSFKDYEVIVADAGSTDKTLQIAKSYNSKIVPGGLPARGRNAGAAVAKGQVLLFLDADVILPEFFLERSMKTFQEKNLGIAGFPNILATSYTIDKVINKMFNSFIWLVQTFLPHVTMAIMVRAEVHSKIKGFDESVLFLEDFYYGKVASHVSRYGLIWQSILVTDRRYKKDGRFTYIKYMLAEIYTIVIGPITSGMFNYKFNHYNSDKHEIRNPKSAP